MGTLPKHVNAKPTLMHVDFHITVDGGDIRQLAVMETYEAVAAALMLKAKEHGLDVCVSRRLRLSAPVAMRRNLRKLGFRFRIPLESATREKEAL